MKKWLAIGLFSVIAFELLYATYLVSSEGELRVAATPSRPTAVPDPVLLRDTEGFSAIRYYSLGLADGADFQTRVHLFNPNVRNTLSFTLTTFDGAGNTIAILAAPSEGFTATYTGNLGPFESVYFESAQLGSGLNTGFATLEVNAPAAAWQRERLLDSLTGDDLDVATHTFAQPAQSIHVFSAVPAQDTPAESRLEFKGGTGLIPYIGGRNTSLFSTTTFTLTVYEADTGNALGTTSLGLAPRGGFFQSLASLFALPVPGDYLIRAQGGEVIPFMSFATDEALTKYPATQNTRSFTLDQEGAAQEGAAQGGAMVVTAQTFPFFHLASENIETTFTITDALPEQILDGEMEIVTSDVPAVVAFFNFINTSPGAAARYFTSNLVEFPSADMSGTGRFYLDQGNPAVAGVMFNASAAAATTSSHTFGSRAVFTLDGSLDWQNDWANSSLVIHNHENSVIPMMRATLDDAGNLLDVALELVQPGINDFPVNDIAGAFPDTAILLLEPAETGVYATADLLLHGRDMLSGNQQLDRISASLFGGERTIGHYPNLLRAWADETFFTCLGNPLDVRDILAYLNRDYACN